jgi:protein SCO1/2
MIRWAALLLILLLAAGWAAVWLGGRDPAGPVAAAVRSVGALVASRSGGGTVGGLRVGGPFTLIDQQGRTVSDTTFRGRWMLVYFGYTYCPDVCPTELQTVAAALHRLGPDAASIVPLFITIDPERDTPAVLADYVKLFDDRLIGLTGTPAQIRDVAAAYKVYYAKVTPEGAKDYLMDHSSFLYLMGPDGSFRALLRPGGEAGAMADAIERRMHS